MASIRRARADDAEAVFALLQQLAQTYPPDRAAFDSTFAVFADGDAEATLLLVSEDDDGAVRGYALTTFTRLLHTNGSSAQLQELVVDETARGTGVGSDLVGRLEDICRERRVRQLTVASRRSAGFYERMGYRSTADFLKRTFD